MELERQSSLPGHTEVLERSNCPHGREHGLFLTRTVAPDTEQSTRFRFLRPRDQSSSTTLPDQDSYLSPKRAVDLLIPQWHQPHNDEAINSILVR